MGIAETGKVQQNERKLESAPLRWAIKAVAEALLQSASHAPVRHPERIKGI